MEIASPPHNMGNMLPILEPTNIPIQTNFLVIVAANTATYANTVRAVGGTNGRNID